MRVIGKVIRKRRKEQRLTVRQLALMTGLSPGFLSALENNKRVCSDKVANLLAKALKANDWWRYIPEKLHERIFNLSPDARKRLWSLMRDEERKQQESGE